MINPSKIDPELDTTSKSTKNRFLLMDFWEFAIVSTLMAVFFPWSLLYCVFFHGIEDTKCLVMALAHDWLKTILAILSVLIPLAILIVFAFIFLLSKK